MLRQRVASLVTGRAGEAYPAVASDLRARVLGPEPQSDDGGKRHHIVLLSDYSGRCVSLMPYSPALSPQCPLRSPQRRLGRPELTATGAESVGTTGFFDAS